MIRIAPLACLLCALLAACSGPGEKSPPPAMLCAAEALKAARDPARPMAEQDSERGKISGFTRMLSADDQQKAWTMVDRLADRSPDRALIDPQACDALRAGAPKP